jgi:hypothetical protein
MHTTKALRQLDTWEALHRQYALFDSFMVLFQMVVQIEVRAMAYLFPYTRL